MDSPYMTVPEMMEYLHVCKKTAYQLIRTKKIPSYRPTERKTLVKRTDVDKYITKHRR